MGYSNRMTLRAAVVCLFLIFFGCSVSSDSGFLRSELSNQGPLALSRENPYVAANLLLGKELEASPLVKGFIQYRGAPDAIEVKRRTLAPVKLYFFYLDRAEGYVFEDRSGDWLIKGPESLPPQVLLQLSNIPRSNGDVPVILKGGITGIRKRGSGSNFVAQPAPQTFNPNPPPGLELTAPSLAAGGPATASVTEESASGDLIHHVTFPGETLRIITTWYTGDVNNTDRIARINGLANPDTLYIGSKVLIPRYLSKTTEPLPYAEVENRNRAIKAGAIGK